MSKRDTDPYTYLQDSKNAIEEFYKLKAKLSLTPEEYNNMKQSRKIKSMNVDEMAEFLDMSPCNHCTTGVAKEVKCHCLRNCRKYIKQWLMQES